MDKVDRISLAGHETLKNLFGPFGSDGIKLCQFEKIGALVEGVSPKALRLDGPLFKSQW